MKLTKKKAEEFARALCGTSKGLEKDYSEIWTIRTGHMRYSFWILNSRIYVQIFVINHCVSSYFFDYVTLDPDFIYTDDYKEKNKREDDRASKLEFLLWLRDDSKYKLNIPDALIKKFNSF